jgi:transposase
MTTGNYNRQHTITMNRNILHIGLDVHAESISIATADGARDGEVRFHSRIPNDLRALDTALRKLAGPDHNRELRVCYEAGPTGFVIARHLAKRGIACLVAAPSLIPKGRADRIKTDRRDALMLARLHRAGELTAVHIPDATDESIRDLCRARTDAVDDKRRATSRLKSFLLRHGHRTTEKTPWSEARMRTLRKTVLPLPAMGIVLEEYIQAIDDAHQRIDRLEKQMELAMATWDQAPVVRALMALRGFRLVSAMITVSELGDIHRFPHPRQLMAYLGLVPSEASSGGKRSQGGLTKTGNSHLRWLINESAQHYRLPPKISRGLGRRQQDIDSGHRREVKIIAWKCQHRLYEKGRKMAGRLVMRQKVQIALARELCGFVWAIMKVAQPVPAGAAPHPKAGQPAKQKRRLGNCQGG